MFLVINGACGQWNESGKVDDSKMSITRETKSYTLSLSIDSGLVKEIEESISELAVNKLGMDVGA